MKKSVFLISLLMLVIVLAFSCDMFKNPTGPDAPDEIVTYTHVFRITYQVLPEWILDKNLWWPDKVELGLMENFKPLRGVMLYKQDEDGYLYTGDLAKTFGKGAVIYYDMGMCDTRRVPPGTPNPLTFVFGTIFFVEAAGEKKEITNVIDCPYPGAAPGSKVARCKFTWEGKVEW